jgi:hypothetical protein
MLRIRGVAAPIATASVVVAAFATFPSAAPAQGYDPASLQQRTVVTATEAFGMLPPELIAAPLVKRITVSADGRYALVERAVIRFNSLSLEDASSGREPAVQELRLILWDSRSRTGKEVWTAPLPGAAVQQIAWLPGSDAALVVLGEPHGAEARRGLLRIKGATGKAEAIGLTGLGDVGMLQLSVSPARPLAILRHSPYRLSGGAGDGDGGKPAAPRATLHLLGESGALGEGIALPEGARFEAVRWDTEANPVVLLREKSGSAAAWYALDGHAAQMRPLANEPALYAPAGAPVDPAESLPIRLKSAAMPAKEAGLSQSVGLLWLESKTGSERPRALICGDGAGGRLLPRGDVLIYQSQGAAWAVPLLRLKREEYTALAGGGLVTEQVAAIKQAKQIGLALLMYLREHDETLPRGDDVRTHLGPYVSSPDLLDGFTYSHKGGKLAGMEDPAETEIGSLDAPGGRVRVYADGHVVLDR